MSVSNDSPVAPRLSESDDLRISDTGSGSSQVENETRENPICPYSTSRFFDQECSRYRDCPTHTVERSPVSDNDGRTTTEMRDRGSGQAEETAQRVNVTEEHGAGSDWSSMESNSRSVSMPSQDIGSNSQQSDTDADTNTTDSEQSTSHPAPRTVQVSSTREEGITLREALNQTVESLTSLSIENPVSPQSRTNTSSPIIRLPNQSAAAPLVISGEMQRPPSRLNPIAPEFAPRPGRSAQDIALPRWQPDSEVTICPICRTQFSFFVRKHHCRKCGRVVCNACSPHRITIPHQYIVRPPGERAYQRYSFLGDEGGVADFTALGGGEQVRLCNPCVPDPNTTPPRTQHSTSHFSPRSTHNRSQSGSSGNYNNDNTYSRPSQYLVLPNSPHDAYSRSRSVTMSSGPGPSRVVNPGPYFPPQNRIITGTPPTYYPHPHPHPQLVQPIYRRTSFLNHQFPGASFIDIGNGSSSSSSAAMVNRPLPPAPQIPEEDECPICHRELPSRELSNFEALRESHIESCIKTHSSYNPSSSVAGGSNRPLRRSGMFPYSATEKDCVDSAECTICLEEFEVGVPMARLECLCRFHRACITAWFVNHPGRCPVHQHDSLGY
ncbi:FYVE-domain-containing protein [Daldinia sp. FL1419]|nr:FYVE-domain-containing protein [Daldinia sp. FL1419]